MSQLTKKEIIINGLRIQYYERKNSSAYTLLFLHGWRSDGLIWKDVIDLLPQNIDSIAIDLPGFGKSGVPPETADLAYYCACVREFVLRLGLSRVVLVGHSFGGRTAIKLASERPDWLSGIVLVNAAGKEDRGVLKRFKYVAAKLVKPFFSFRLMQPLRRRIYERLGAGDYVATPKLKRVFQNIISEDLSGVLPLLTVPVLVISGETDKEVPKSFTYELRDKIPQADFFMFPNAGHFSFLDEAQLFCIKLEHFLKERVTNAKT